MVLTFLPVNLGMQIHPIFVTEVSLGADHRQRSRGGMLARCREHPMLVSSHHPKEQQRSQ